MSAATTAPTEHATPSDRARRLVTGAVDGHVHIGPDVIGRRIDDLDLAGRFADLGMDGFVLKSHYVSTAERAAVVTKATSITCLGAIVLNAAVGGLNALAVEIAGREGARVVWLPTFDAENQRAHRKPLPPGATPPLWQQLQDDLAARGLGSPPVPVLDDAGRPLDALLAVLETVAAHDMVLATGHLGREEVPIVVDAALEHGVRHVVITHPEFPAQDIPADEQTDLARRGAVLEHCFTQPHTGKVPWEVVLDNIRAVGPEHCVVSSDLGQPANPPVEDGMALFADRLLEHGFSDAEVRGLCVDRPRVLAGLPGLTT